MKKSFDALVENIKFFRTMMDNPRFKKIFEEEYEETSVACYCCGFSLYRRKKTSELTCFGGLIGRYIGPRCPEVVTCSDYEIGTRKKACRI